VGILRSMYLRSGGLSAPMTTPRRMSLHPESSIRISFGSKKWSRLNAVHQSV